MAKKALVLTLRVDGLNETLKAFKRMPPEATKQLKAASQTISKRVAVSAKSAGLADEAPQSALVAKTVKAAKDRVPVVTVGGTRKLGRHRVPAWRLVFASEFGQNVKSGWYSKPQYKSSTGRQYRPHNGTQGYWFFPTVEREQATIAREWREAADGILDEFAGGG